MEDEVNERSAISGQQSAEGQEKAVELEKNLAEARARVAELEQVVVGKATEIEGLKQSRSSLEAKLKDMSGSLSEAMSGYRQIVIQTNPQVPAELIGGETVGAVGESLEKAKALVSQVRKSLEAELSQVRVPAGAPERGGGGLDLSPREKIQQAISRGK